MVTLLDQLNRVKEAEAHFDRAIAAIGTEEFWKHMNAFWGAMPDAQTLSNQSKENEGE